MDSIDYIAEAQRIWTDILNMDARILPVSEYSSLLVVFAATLERRDRIAELRGREGEAGMCAGLAYAELRKHLGAAACMGFTVLDRRVAQLAAERERLEKESENAWARPVEVAVKASLRLAEQAALLKQAREALERIASSGRRTEVYALATETIRAIDNFKQ